MRLVIFTVVTKHLILSRKCTLSEAPKVSNDNSILERKASIEQYVLSLTKSKGSIKQTNTPIY